MRIERELMRGAGPLAVLKLLERREMYGYELVDALAKQSGGVLAMGQSTLYPMLYNLEAKGLIRPTWRQAESGRERKYYSLTGKGRKQLQRDARQWQALTEAMASLGVLASSQRSLPEGLT
ncbi:MAG: PadR family transcriptional regulator [Phycisphaerales bacterium]